MNGWSPLVDALDIEAYGSKAVQLGAAIRAGLPVPDGFAISHQVVAAVGARDAATTDRLVALLATHCAERTHWAVRSSALGEDTADASFAGIHKSILGVTGVPALLAAVREVHESARDEGALAYRRQMRVEGCARMAVVVQRLVDADVGGVMFTRNPVTGADERVIEASWGLGEVVVSGLVTPDRYVLDAVGRLLERQLGEKDIAVRRISSGGTCEEPVAAERVYTPCLAEPDLAGLHTLAEQCDAAFAAREHDIEFAIQGGALSLLQRRPITSA